MAECRLRAMACRLLVLMLTGAALPLHAAECETLSEGADGHQAFDAVAPTAAPELDSATIGQVVAEPLQIFDLDDPAEDLWLYRLANQLHIRSRPETLLEPLQFRSGDAYSARRLRESERILRTQRWLYDARVVPWRRCGDRVDVKVVARDVWSLVPTGDVERSGGETSLLLGLQEVNLFGRGERLGVQYLDGIDRSGPSIFYQDDYLAGGPWALQAEAAHHTDGGRLELGLGQPFRSLDDRRSQRLEMLYDKRHQPLFDRGFRVARFGQEQLRLRALTSASSGRHGNSVHRWTLGLEFEQLRFDRITGEPLQPARLAEDRWRLGPLLRFESIEDHWDSSLTLDFHQRPQDVYLGRRYGVTLGYAPDLPAADGERLLLEADWEDGWQAGARTLLFADADFEAAWHDGSSENLTARMRLQGHYRHHRAFGLFAELEGIWTRNLTPDRQLLLGGASGLRGYPNRFQAGDRSVRLRLEERWFSSANPFRLLLVGAAVFVDAGRAWFPGEANDDETGWLANAGIGLRLGSNRGLARSLLHIDLAVPLRRGGPDVDDVLFGVSVRRSF